MDNTEQASAAGQHVTERQILDGANYLLRAVGIHAAPIKNFGELAESASSLCVAEAMFHTRLQDIVRQPTQDSHFVHNAQVVINTLANSVLNKNLEYISGEDVHSGDMAAIASLINIFIESDSRSTIVLGKMDMGQMGMGKMNMCKTFFC